MENPEDLTVSGEWSLENWQPMANRLKTFWPINPQTGERVSQIEWAAMIGIKQTTLSGILRGSELKFGNHQKIIAWLMSIGRDEADILWWQTGKRRNPQVSVGGIAQLRWISVPALSTNGDSPSPVKIKKKKITVPISYMVTPFLVPLMALKTVCGMRVCHAVVSLINTGA